MARIGLSTSNFALLPEGTQVLKCVGCNYNEKFGNIELVLETKDGIKHTERYNLVNASGQQNDKALNAFSFTARKLLHGNPDNVDTDELVGKYIKVRVEHEPITTKQGKNMTVARLQDKEEVYEDEVHDWFPNDGVKNPATIDFNNLVI